MENGAHYLSNASLSLRSISLRSQSQMDQESAVGISSNPDPMASVAHQEEVPRTPNGTDPRVLGQSESFHSTRETTFGLAPDRIANAMFVRPGISISKEPSVTVPARPKYERMHSGRLSVYIPEEEVDAIPTRSRYRIRDMLLTLWAIGSYIFDYVMDWIVAAGFYRNEDYVWFGLTVTFIVVPHLTMMCFSLAWYLQDQKHHEVRKSFTSRQWLVRIVVLVLQLAPVLRYVDSLRYGYRFRYSQHVSRLDLYESLCFENADAAMLRLFEAFMEAAPQLVLQIYILVRKQTKESTDYEKFDFLQILQIISIFSSWFSLATAMATFHRAQRFSQHAKGSMSVIGTIMQFGWHLFIFASRVIAIALFTAHFTYWGPVACVVHVAVMIVWVFCMRTEFCPNRWLEYLYNISVSFMYLFAFLNVKDTPTRWKYAFYYGLYYLENVLLITLWYTHTLDQQHWFRQAAMAAVIGGFWVGIFVFMIPYYWLLHPDKGWLIRKRRYNVGTQTVPNGSSDWEPKWLKSVLDFCL